MHDSVYDIAGDDPRKAKLLRVSLEKLATSSDDRLREMAQSVLNGETDLRQAAASDAYGDALGESFDQFTTYYARLDNEERAAVIAETEHQLDKLLDGPATPPR